VGKRENWGEAKENYEKQNEDTVLQKEKFKIKESFWKNLK